MHREASYLNVDDVILYGKYKNKKGRIVAISVDPKGNPTIEVEPIPKGRKQNKIMGLFKVWKANPEERLQKKLAWRVARRIAAQFLKVPVVDQSPGLCGPSALKAVLAYWGIDTTEQKLAELAEVDPEVGATEIQLIKAAEALGFRTLHKFEATLDDLRQAIDLWKIPVLVDWFSVYDTHWSVVCAINEEYVYLMDPEKVMMRAVPIERWVKVWFTYPGEQISPQDLQMRSMLLVYPVDRGPASV
jgi:predicted double-glycine peptidase